MKKLLMLALLLSVQTQGWATNIVRVDYQPTAAIAQKYEIALDLDTTYENPFDTSEVTIDAVFTAPSGRQIKVPAFWYLDFNRRLIRKEEKLTAAKKPDWRIRFAAQETGVYQFFISIKDKEGDTFSETFQFTSNPSTNKGFIRVDKLNSRWLSYDNGDFYLPIGHNLAWGTNQGTYDYDLWLTKMNAAKENWSRVWMNHYYNGQSLEWSQNHKSGWFHGLGIYNLQGAWKLDQIISKAEASGVYIQLVTQHHGQFSQKTNSTWDENPYNSANGGFLNNGAEFFTHPEAKELYKRKMRYTVARWGYSTSILAWELWNEVHYTDNYEQNYPNVVAWHKEMAQYLRSIDPWSHLITTSARNEDNTLWSLPELDLTQVHYYGTGYKEVLRQSHLSMQQYKKPNIIGEFGDDIYSFGTDTTGTVIHEALWATSMVGGGAMAWYWDKHIHANNLYYHWAALSAFWQNEDLRQGPIEIIEIKTTGGPKASGGARFFPGGKSWSPAKQSEFWLKSDGSIEGIANLPTLLHGSNKSHLGREIIFHLNSDNNMIFALTVGRVSSWKPGNLQLFIDDQTVPVVNETPKPPKRYEASIPAGKHKIRISNSGIDWLSIDSLEFGMPITATAGYAFTNGNMTYAWIYDRDYQKGSSPNGLLTGVEAVLPNLAGKFIVEQWNTRTGTILGSSTIISNKDLLIPVKPFSADIALKIRKTGS